MGKKPYEIRKQEKEERLAQLRRESKQNQFKSALKWGTILTVILAFLGLLVFLGMRSQGELLGEFHSSQGDEHIPDGEIPEGGWSTNPPTSGPHYNNTLGAGFYETPQALGNIIHSLEHGAIVIYYKSDIPEDELNQLRELFEKNRRFKLIVTSYDDMDTNYALTAWTWLDKFDEFDSARMEKFIRDHHDKRAPEIGAPIGMGPMTR